MLCGIRSVLLRDIRRIVTGKEYYEALSGYHTASDSEFKRENAIPDDRNIYRPVADFYAGKSVFITGGTGFLGKIFVEKLLYSCKDIENIFLLVRAKNDGSAENRIRQMTDNPVFARIKKEKPQVLRKIVPVVGDITAPHLGINAKDSETLADKVSVVFHAAATVKFNEPLKVALNVNLEGTMKMLKLCQRMRNMDAFVYISTAFCHTNRKVIDEIVYPAPMDINDVYRFVEKNGDAPNVTAKILDGRPNTYTFTKALAESYVAKNHGEVPTAIVRPSIVTSTKNEPLRNWLDNWYGATGLFTDAALGLNRITLGDYNHIIDLIPVDYVVNLSIIAASRCKKSEDVYVYNSCSSSSNPITWGDAHTLFTNECTRHGFYDLPFGGTAFTNSKLKVKLLTMLLQTTPAYVADFWLKMKGEEPRYVKPVTKAKRRRDSLDYFTSHSWVWNTNSAQSLVKYLSPEDEEEYPCDPVDIDWTEYMKDYCLGVQKYLIEPKKNQVKTRVRVRDANFVETNV